MENSVDPDQMASSFNTFANKADPELPDQGLLCLLMEKCLDMILH